MKRPIWLHDIQARQQHTEVSLEGKKPLLGIDYGEKFCGVAWSPDGSSVLPLGVFPRATFTENLEKTLSGKVAVKDLVFGLPKDLNQAENHICEQIRQYAQQWENKGFNIQYIDERFSTRSALGPQDLGAARIDDLAAVHILQSYIDSL